MGIKEKIKKLTYGVRYSSETYCEYLRSKGAKIGEDVTIYVPSRTIIDDQYPWMITIGNHVRITEGCKLLTHDYSWSVLKRYTAKPQNIVGGGILGASGHITIGDNVFIGMNTIICRNVKIGDNVVIGAGSLVTKDCLSGGVYAGVPAKRIADLDEYYKKRKNAQLKEAKELAVAYYERFGKKAPIEIFHEYFMLFSNANNVHEIFKEKMKLCMNYEESLQYLDHHMPEFSSFEEFLEYCYEEE